MREVDAARVGNFVARFVEEVLNLIVRPGTSTLGFEHRAMIFMGYAWAYSALLTETLTTDGYELWRVEMDEAKASRLTVDDSGKNLVSLEKITRFHYAMAERANELDAIDQSIFVHGRARYLLALSPARVKSCLIALAVQPSSLAALSMVRCLASTGLASRIRS